LSLEVRVEITAFISGRLYVHPNLHRICEINSIKLHYFTITAARLDCKVHVQPKERGNDMSYAATFPSMNTPNFRTPRFFVLATVFLMLLIGFGLAHPAEFPPPETPTTDVASQGNLNWDITLALLL
jgi:hypothetical protein